MRPKKPVEEKRVPFNCLVLPATFRAILDSVTANKVSQGVVIDRAVALMCFGEEINPPPAPRTVTPQQVERIARNVQPRVEKQIQANVTPRSSLDAVGPPTSGGRGKIAMESYQPRYRGPLLKPKERR